MEVLCMAPSMQLALNTRKLSHSCHDSMWKEIQ